MALREWPDVNSSLSADGHSLIRHHSHNLGVAMATPSGLVVRSRATPSCAHVVPGISASAVAQHALRYCHGGLPNSDRTCSSGDCVGGPDCLQVPNIKAVQERSVVGIAQQLQRLQQAAAAGRLGQADLAGGTLTVSNIGAIGGTYATPLVNVPEAAIVALGRRVTHNHSMV